MTAEMFAETLQNHQHSMRRFPESRSRTNIITLLMLHFYEENSAEDMTLIRRVRVSF
jgi:hypothetical protein